MAASISEELLLQRALASGLISPRDVAAATARAAGTLNPANRRPTVDALIEMGRLNDEMIAQLCAEGPDDAERASAATLLPGSAVQKPKPTPHTTVDDSAVVVAAADPPPPLSAASAASQSPIGMAQTLDSAAAGLADPASISRSSFPIPNWDKYEFLELLGRGGMGAVYKARDRRLGRVVAIKFIHSESPFQIQRFMQEARAQARLDHPNICKVFEVGLVDNKPYIAMQLVSGLPLDRAGRAMSLLEKVQVIKDVAAAMHAAHEQGIIHRDVKPSNILVMRSATTDGQQRYEPVVMDFGLARDSASDKGLTESGDVLGTPAYMSPEQARGEARRLDRRTDVYSLGATLYDVLVGAPPFEDESVVNIILKVIGDTPRTLRSHDPTLPVALERIVSKCLNKEADQRYPTAQALAEDLGRFLGSQRVLARSLGYGYRLRYWARRNRALAGLAVALLVSLMGLFGFGIYTHFVNLRKEEQAKKEALLAEKFGQSVKDLEWLVRTAYLLPLHDTSNEKTLVQKRMAKLAAELDAVQVPSAERLGAYVLGRGHLALHEWDDAYKQLKRAEALGHSGPELSYALGRVLGELYSRALEEARRSGDQSFVAKRRRELEVELLAPARKYLEMCRPLTTESTSYIEALIDYYNRHYDAALLNAYLARRQTPWLYEADKLAGDVLMARALDARDQGDTVQAERHFADAVVRYEEAAAIGRSDYHVHEAIAEAWIRQEEMDMYRGANPEPKRQQALAAAERALEAAPTESHGHTKEAFATFFQAQYLQFHDSPQRAIQLYEQLVFFGKQAVATHPDDAYAHEITGLSYKNQAEIYGKMRKLDEKLLDASYEYFAAALKINPRFSWAYNDYGSSLSISASWLISHNKNPQDVLNKQIELTRKALEIDEKYLNARVTLVTAYFYMAKWKMEHGESPEMAISEGIKEIRAALKINGRFSFIYGNLATLYYIESLHYIDKQDPSKVYSELAVNNFIKMIDLDKNVAASYEYLASSYYLMGKQDILAKQEPTKNIKQGLAALADCRRLEPQNSECDGVAAQLLALQAEWDRGQGRPFLPALQQAHELARRGTAQAHDNEEMLLIQAEVCLQQASALWQSGQRPAAEISEGLDALARALALAVGWPRALALRGALLVLRSRLQTGQEQQGSLAQARQSLSAAFAGNALLKLRWGAWAEEAERPLPPR